MMKVQVFESTTKMAVFILLMSFQNVHSFFVSKPTNRYRFYLPHLSRTHTHSIQKIKTTTTTTTTTTIAAQSSGSSHANNPLPPGQRPPPQGGDMAFIRPNISRQMDHYLNIRNIGGLDAVNDVYARDPSTNIFWFVGKVARCTGTVSLKLAVQRQWNLIEEHATRLRPIELGRKFGSLELWTALGDSELHIANQIANYDMEQIERYENGVCDESVVRKIEVGFNCEVVTNQGEGFRVERTNEGGPLFLYE